MDDVELSRIYIVKEGRKINENGTDGEGERTANSDELSDPGT